MKNEQLIDLVITVIGLLSFIAGIWFGYTNSQPSKIENENCIIYHKKIYCEGVK